MKTVVLVHGLWMVGVEALVLRWRLRAAGYRTRQFHYRPMARELSQNTHELARFLSQVPGEPVNLVGHSLGGVIAVKTLQDYTPPRIGRVVCMGSPVQGSRTARGLADLPGGWRLMGGSEAVLVEAVAQRWSGAYDLGLIGGRVPLGFGQLFGRLDRPHDGSVAVEETRLEGAADHIVLPVSHLSMLWSKRAAEQVVSFLESGGFVHG